MPATRGSRSSLGRSIDLVGTELPYQPFVEALRPLGEPWQVEGPHASSQLRVFEHTLALLTDRAAAAPVLLVLEDLHWADISTLDLVVFLAHNLADRPVLLLATYRADEPSPRPSACVDLPTASGAPARRSCSSLGRSSATSWQRSLRLAPTLPVPAAVDGRDRRPLRGQPLLRRGAPRGRRATERRASAWPARSPAAARRPARPPDAGASCAWPRPPDATWGTRCSALPRRSRRATCATSLRRAVEHGVLVAEQTTGSFRFRHALLAEAIYATILPGEREELHARLAERARTQRSCIAGGARAALGSGGPQLGGARRVGRRGAPGRGRLRPRGGPRAPRAGARALARRAGRGRARRARPRRALRLDGRARRPTRCCARARSSSARRAIELVGAQDPHRAALLHVRPR